MRGLVRLPRIVHDAVPEGDAAGGERVGELKVVKRGEAGRHFALLVLQALQPGRCFQQVRRHVADGRVASRALSGSRRLRRVTR
jgi:hypothetical protein